MFEKLALPLMCAPMSFASWVALASACARAGVVAGWQGGTLTRMDEFERYLAALAEVDGAPPIVNLPSRIATDAFRRRVLTATAWASSAYATVLCIALYTIAHLFGFTRH